MALDTRVEGGQVSVRSNHPIP